jgi:hypothetical protein
MAAVQSSFSQMPFTMNSMALTMSPAKRPPARTRVRLTAVAGRGGGGCPPPRGWSDYLHSTDELTTLAVTVPLAFTVR